MSPGPITASYPGPETAARPETTIPRCSTWQRSSGEEPMCSLHFQPGSYVARPSVIPPTFTTSSRPSGNSRTSSGCSNRRRRNSSIAIARSLYRDRVADRGGGHGRRQGPDRDRGEAVRRSALPARREAEGDVAVDTGEGRVDCPGDAAAGHPGDPGTGRLVQRRVGEHADQGRIALLDPGPIG